MSNMANRKNYLTFAIVAILAGSVGWGASALGVNKKSEAIAPQVESLPVTNQLVAPTTPSEQLSSEPIQSSAPLIVTAPVSRPAVVRAPATVKRSASSRSRAVSQPDVETAPETARNGESEAPSRSTLPVRERKSGMSNTTKTILAIGGSAATGAIIGGIAGGKKGAAIGAIAGGGGGAIYSVIRKRQGKEVW